MTQATTIWQGATAGGTEFEIVQPINDLRRGFEVRCAALKGGAAGLLPNNINVAARTIDVYGAQFQLRQGDAEQILAAMDAATEPDLRSQREQLAARIAGLRDDIAARKARAWERGDERNGVVPDATLAAQVATARQALADFDVAHPEVLAQIEQERAAATQRAMWN